MLPLILNPHTLKVALAGAGEARDRRAAMLAEAGVEARILPENPADDLLQGLQVLFVAGLPEGEARLLADRARRQGILVNVEDVPALCDFHVPAMVRRGDLLLTVSTGGTAPALSRVLREWLAGHFGPEWTARLKEIGAARARWRSEGLSSQDVSRRLRALVQGRAWL